MSDRNDQDQLTESLEGVFIPEDATHVVDGVNLASQVNHKWEGGYPSVEISVSFEGHTLLTVFADLAVGDESRGTYTCSEFDMRAQVLAAVQKTAEKLEDLVEAYGQQRIR